jgi:hypothetical protein
MRTSISSVHETISGLRRSLLAPSPEGLCAHLPALEAAEAQMRALPPDTDPEALRALAEELKIAARLIEHGMQLEQAWTRIVASNMFGYQAGGDARPLQAPVSISLEG